MPATTIDSAAAREDMVVRQIAARGVEDPHVLDAMRQVPREAFLPPELAAHAYEDTPLPIAEDQTISQPYIVALMLEAAEIRPGATVLEIGTGSGYAAAVAARIAGRVISVERHLPLAVTAQASLAAAGIDTVAVIHADGSVGWPAEAPYDAIIVTAAAPAVPDTLARQLAPLGRLVVPAGQGGQTLVKIVRTGEDSFETHELGGVRFVPLVGREGFDPDTAAPADYCGVLPPPAAPRQGG